MPSSPLIFPPCAAGTGEILPGRVNAAGARRWARLAVELDTRGSEGGRPTVGALMRAIGAGEIILSRREGEKLKPGKMKAEITRGVHRGCPVDEI